VALRSVLRPRRQRFLVGAMAHVALHLRWAGRGLAGPVVCHANDLAQAAARAGIHGGTPVNEDRFGACTAALAEDLGHCGHQHPAPHLDVPLSPGHTRDTGNFGAKSYAFPGQTSANLVQGVPLEAKTSGGGSDAPAAPSQTAGWVKTRNRMIRNWDDG